MAPALGAVGALLEDLRELHAAARQRVEQRLHRRGVARQQQLALLEVDGGVNLETARMMMEEGADVLVAGSALFAAPDAKRFIERVRADWREIHA